MKMYYIAFIGLFAKGKAKSQPAAIIVRALFFVIAGLVAPEILPVSQSIAHAEAVAPLRELGPDYTAGKLIGTMRSGSISGAVFENSAGEQKFYRKGVTFSDGTRITEVNAESIVVKTPEGNSIEYLVTRGTPGRAGAVPASHPVIQPPSYSEPQASVENETKPALRGKRRRGITTGGEE